jgi:23S rRNA pseudouridine2605 synthase
MDHKIRLNKHIADCGIASRRKADELISEGHVIVNGKKVFELGAKVDPKNDRITVNGKPLRSSGQKVYLMFHKPKNIVTTLEDPEGRPTIGDFVRRMPVRVFPVGRLDWDTEGLILLTNDGDFSQRVTHPSHDVTKTYLVKVSGQPTQEQLGKLLRGVSIVGGKVSAKSVERMRKGAGLYDWIKIVITEGKNRQIRQMFEKIGFDVMKLQRIAIGRLKLPSSLKRGDFQLLTPKDLERIFVADASVHVPEDAGQGLAASGGPNRGGKDSGQSRPQRRTQGRRTVSKNRPRQKSTKRI